VSPMTATTSSVPALRFGPAAIREVDRAGTYLPPARIWIFEALAFAIWAAVANSLCAPEQWWRRGPGHRGGAGPGG